MKATEEHKKKMREYRKNHREKYREYQRKYYQTHREYYINYSKNKYNGSTYRIEKAIDYIEKIFYIDEVTGKYYLLHTFDISNLKELSDILKGSDKE